MYNGGYVIRYYLGFVVLTAAIVKSSVFCCVTPCRPLKLTLHFGGSCRLRLQGRRKAKARNQHEAGSKRRLIVNGSRSVVYRTGDIIKCPAVPVLKAKTRV
jgi:hypothetical protein